MQHFISYSHADKKFVDKLALSLVQNEIPIWMDRWELRLGDSLLSKVQEAIKDAGSLLVVLSKASVKSAWCKEELNAGLVRQLKEQEVFVLPLLKEDCEIPPFLQDKMYADFRKKFDDGLNTVLAKLASTTNESQARIEDKEWFNDMSFDDGLDQRGYWFRITSVSHSKRIPYSILAVIDLAPDETVSRWYHMERKDDSGEYVRRAILNALAKNLKKRGKETDVILRDHRAVIMEFPFELTFGMMLARVEIRRLGNDTGGDVYFRIRQQINDYVSRAEEIAENRQKAKEAAATLPVTKTVEKPKRVVKVPKKSSVAPKKKGK